jgi:hypothetical protein
LAGGKTGKTIRNQRVPRRRQLLASTDVDRATACSGLAGFGIANNVHANVSSGDSFHGEAAAESVSNKS